MSHDSAPPDSSNIRVGVVGLGKMGLSHLAMVRAHPHVTVAGVTDSTGYILDVLGKYTGLRTFGSIEGMLDEAELDAVIIATPTNFHARMVETVVERGVHVFCEKPLSLSADDSERLVIQAQRHRVVSQVGYHNRFVGTFREVERLLGVQAIGRMTHIRAEAYGPVVLRSRASTWRSNKSEGGGCLYDYAAHPLNLMTWYAGRPCAVGGTVLGSVFSENTDDEVYSTLYFGDGVTGQLSVNWSDDSYRKMTTSVTITGTHGKIHADRQEMQVYLRADAPNVDGYSRGWTSKYTTELTDNVWFYLRGEEYSAQLDYFVESVQRRRVDGINSFASALVTDSALTMLTTDAAGRQMATMGIGPVASPSGPVKKGRFGWRQ